ncbi:MAG: ketol-acid reductoisomerase [Candidatus Helarchaeota archaeon]
MNETKAKHATIYHDEDVSDELVEALRKKVIAIIGYGNQGRSQALNLRDSGMNVIIGNIEDEYKKKAQEDGFKVESIEGATKHADILMILIPDEIQADIFEEKIKPNLTSGKTIDFATGYNVAFKEITGMQIPIDVDIIMIAPRMIGVGVREKYLSGEGFFSFIAMEQDATGNAKNTLLGLAKALGTTKAGAIETSFRDEAHLDLYTEQAFGPAFGQVLMNSLEVLVESGYPVEAIFVEIYMSGEFSFTLKEMAEIGIVEQMKFHSPTSQYGSLTRGARFINPKLKELMAKSLSEIQSGKFAREWKRAQKRGKDPVASLKQTALQMPINKLEREVRKRLKMNPEKK